MSTTNMLASDIMDAAAALLNDAAKDSYKYTDQLPYLKIACDELQEQCELYNIPYTNETSLVIPVGVGVNRIVSVDNAIVPPLPKYPDNLVEIQRVWNRQAGTAGPFILMSKVEYIPHYWDDQTQVELLSVWAWMDQEIRFVMSGANQGGEIKLDYIKTLFPQPITPNTTLGIINSKSFLSYRTAALIASFSGENPTRAEELNMNALLAMDRLLGISVKGKQAITTRRRPFMSGYKSRVRDF